MFQTRIPPGFVIAFVVIALVHPHLGLPSSVINALRILDVVLLAAAMATLGRDTTVAKPRFAGRDSLVLGAILFGYLVVVGGLAIWNNPTGFLMSGLPLARGDDFSAFTSCWHDPTRRSNLGTLRAIG